MLKRVLNLIATTLVIPLLVIYRTCPNGVRNTRIFPSLSQLLSLLPGLSGQYIRRAFYRRTLTQCSTDCCISFGTILTSADASIGDRVYIGPNCMVGDINIGVDTLIGSNVSVINGNAQHGISQLEIPIREQKGKYPKITIGKDCWIGDRSIVMANIGNHCVIGAGAVVTKNIPDFAIAFGNPARVYLDRRQMSSQNSIPTAPRPTQDGE